MRVPLIDLKSQYECIREDIEEPLTEFLKEQHFILGPAVETFEAAVAEYCGVSHAIGVSSGSDALLVALMALDIGPGDEVITSTYTFFATAGAISRLGAKPVFVDIESDSFNLCTKSIERAIASNTKAIIPVHLYGQCANMSEIMEIGKRHALPIIEDAAQSLGATFEGKQAGSMGLMGCISFFPSKNLGGFGDGGMIMTDDANLADKIRVLRSHGAKPKYHHRMIGGNFRLDSIHAFILSKKLPYLNRWLEARRVAASKYNQLFSDSGLVDRGQVSTPKEVSGAHSYNQYVICVPGRAKLASHLKDKGIDSAIYYPIPLHLQECFSELGYERGALPVSERAAEETLAIPICPAINENAQQYVVQTISEFYT